MKRTSAVVLSLLLFVGCAASGAGRQTGPARPTTVQFERWSFQNQPGHKVVTPHYDIYTTIDDPELLATIPQLMEGAFEHYRRLVPGLKPGPEPMQCYLFATRTQWAAFTRSRTGADAAVYLQINRGGYTIGDWYVAYFIGDLGTYSVAAHEGFHQFVARHFKTRVPPFLEEGLACMFEGVRWERGLPRWDLDQSRSRLRGLRNAIDGRSLISLPQLVAMHAGQVVEGPQSKIEAFYAQNWAFAKFLWEGEEGRLRPRLQEMLSDAAAGTLYGYSRRSPPPAGMWDPESARPLLEHYLRMDFDSIDAAYQKYIRRLASRHREPAES